MSEDVSRGCVMVSVDVYESGGGGLKKGGGGLTVLPYSTMEVRFLS